MTVLRIELGAEDLARSRFAVSPLFELDNVLRLLSGISRRRLPVLWERRLRSAYDELRAGTDLDAVLALMSHRRGAAFTAPPPAGLAQTVADDLAAMRATPLPVARREIRDCLTLRPTRDDRVLGLLRDRNVVAILADAVEQAWQALLAPDWLQLRAVVERDVVHRAGQLGLGGWEAALSGLSPQLRWHDRAIEVLRHPDRCIGAGSAGLLLVPSVLIWPHVAVFDEDPWPRTLVYPARGSAALWEARPTAADGLARLIGSGRAQVLTALDTPASTTHLVRQLGLSLGTVGGAPPTDDRSRPGAAGWAARRRSPRPPPEVVCVIRASIGAGRKCRRATLG